MEYRADLLISELADKLKNLFEDDPVVALAGAHAKGVADSKSDLDIFLFGKSPKSHDERLKIIQEICDSGTAPYVSWDFSMPWGGGADFTYKGGKVEAVLRTFEQTEQVISRCMNGEFDIIPQTWTSNGYYTYIYLSEMSFMKPVYDPDGWLCQMKQKTETFPEKLRKSIIDVFLDRAGTWIDNFHYESAVERGDTLFVAPIVVHTVMDMIQVVFALNGRYFTGDKKVEAALRKMPYCPKSLLDNLELLLTFNKDIEMLRHQAVVLKDVYYELRDYGDQTV